jgi:hypothetical protein
MTYPPESRPSKTMRQERAQIIGTWQIKLTVVEVALFQLEHVYRERRSVSAHLAKIRRWLEECWRSVGQGAGKPLSAEVQRRADMVDAARRAVVGDCTTPGQWAAWLLCIDALIQDVEASIIRGRPRCWSYLGQTWGTLARQFLDRAGDERAEEAGMEIYLRIAEVTGWA